MSTARFSAPALSLTIVLICGVSYGQDYPSKPIRIVTGSAGGSGDFSSRLLAQPLAANLGQQIVIDNRGGSGPGETVAKAPPDGYTLLVEGASFWLGSLLQEMPFDAIRDFAPLTLLVSSTNLLVVHPSVPTKSVKELIALAKARPGELNYGMGGYGGANHLAAELFKQMAGVNIVRVNYKGAGPAVTALIGGEVQVMVVNVPSVATPIKSGRLRALAVTSAQPSALMPGLPTVAETVPGYDAPSVSGMFTPAKTSPAIIAKLYQEIARILNRPDMKQRYLDGGQETVGNTPEQFGAFVKTEIAKWGKVLKEARD